MRSFLTTPRTPTSRTHPASRTLARRRLLGMSVVASMGMLLPVGLAQPASATSSRDFTIRLSPSVASVTAGGSTAMSVQLTRGRRFRSAVSYRIEAPFAGVTVVPSTPNSRGVSFQIVAAANSPAATGTVRVVASGGGRSRSAVATLQVIGQPAAPKPPTPPPAPPSAGDFTVTLDQPAILLRPESAIERVIFVSGTGGYAGSPRFEVTGLPAGVVAAFTPPSSRVGTTMRLTANSALPRGTFPIQVRAIDGDKVRTADGVITTSFVGPFTLAAVFDPAQAAPGGSTTLKVTIGPAPGSTVIPDVELSFLGLPNGTTLTSTGTRTNTSANFTVSFATTVVQSDYVVQVRGQSGSNISTTSVQLKVSAQPSASLAQTALRTAKGGVASTEVFFSVPAGQPKPAFIIEGAIPGGSSSILVTTDNKVFVQVFTSATTPVNTYSFNLRVLTNLGTTVLPFTVQVF
jgi:hypothetical protein